MNKNRATKSLSILLAMCMLLGMLPMTALADNFSDIKGHWAESQINEMINEGIVKGYPDGSFKPDGDISRAEFVSLIVKAFKLTKAKGKDFDDISNHWAKDAILTANAHGIVNGYSDTKFGPDNPITREQMAVMIVKAAHLTDNSKGKTFVDSHDISEWAKKAVAIASSNQLITGYPDNTFKPSGNTSRAEATAVLSKSLILANLVAKVDYSLIEKSGKYGPETGDEIVKGDVVIKAKDTILQNLVIKGDLTIAKEVGDGDVTLNNIKVEGKTYIRGGGIDSIHINQGEYREIIIERTITGAVRILTANVQRISITISENDNGEDVILNGEIKTVTIKADGIKVISQGPTTIDKIEVSPGLKDVKIQLAEDTEVKEIIVNSKVDIAGKGKIDKASGTKVKESTFATAPKTSITPRTGGGGGGGSSSGGSSSGGTATIKVSSISVSGEGGVNAISIDKGTLQMIARVEPSNASNKSVTWSVYQEEIATINADGLLTVVAEGTVEVRARAKDGSGVEGRTSIVITDQPVTPPVDKNIQSLETMADINVENGTEFNAIGLPSTVEVSLDDNSTQNLAVSWDSGKPAYNKDQAGEYTFTGTLSLPANVTNTSDLVAVVRVIVGKKDVLISVSAISVSGEAVVGKTLTATANTEHVTYQWLRADTEAGTYTEISGATDKTYTLDDADQDKYIKVKVTGKSGLATGDMTSDPTVQVKLVNAEIGPASGTFYHNDEGDITATITWNSATKITKIITSEVELVENTDYTVAGNTLTIKKEYFKKEPVSSGGTGFGIEFDRGSTVSLTVNIATKYQVVFDANGGSGAMDNDTATNDQNFTFPFNGFTAPEGKMFEKWKVKKDGNNEYYAEGTNKQFLDGHVESDGKTIKIYAVWEDIPKYVVTFSVVDNKGGTISAKANGVDINSSDQVDKGSDLVFTATPNTGYEIKQWKYNDTVYEGTEKDFEHKNLWKDFNVTVEFVATEEKYTVTYDANTGSGDVPTDSTEYPANAEVTVEGEGSLTKEHYLFDGWNTQADGSGKAYAENDTFNIAANTILYAQWVRDVSSIAIKESPTKTEYADLDNLDLDGLVVTVNYADGGTANVPFADFEANYLSTSFPHEQELYKNEHQTLNVHWDKNKSVVAEIEAFKVYYRVTFDAQGGTVTPTGALTKGNEAGNILGESNLPAPTRDGYTFEGWFDAETEGSEVKAYTQITNNMTIYARWAEVITPVSVTGVSLSKTTMNLTVGADETLGATVTPENATNKNVSWTSSNEAVAIVDATGKVTAVAVGSATITVTTEDGNKIAECTVTVEPAPDTVIHLKNIPGITTPAKDGVPVTAVGANDQYTGTVAWNPTVTDKFEEGTAYIATITLTAKTGYTLAGITEANFFSVIGATSTTYDSNSKTVTVTFPTTGDKPAQTGSPKISGDPIYGVGLMAQSDGLGHVFGGVTFTWYRSEDANFDENTDTPLTSTGTDGQNYTIVEADIGKYLIVKAVNPNSTGYGFRVVGPVIKANVVGDVEGSISAYYLSDGDALYIRGINPDQGELEVAVAINGTDYTTEYTPIGENVTTADITGLTGVSANTKVKIRKAATTTHNASKDKVIEGEKVKVRHKLTLEGGGLTVNKDPDVFGGHNTYSETYLIITITPPANQVVDTLKVNGEKKDLANDGNYYFTITKDTTIEVTYTDIKTITIQAIQGVTAPVVGDTPASSITANDQYTGTITWDPNQDPFVKDTEYKATINLTAKHPYSFEGVAADFFTVAGATATNAAGSGVVKAVFPKTGAEQVDDLTIASFHVPAPAKGETPKTDNFTGNGTQFDGTIAWYKSGGINEVTGYFEANTVYIAKVSLVARDGYTFAGLAVNSFTHNDAASTNFEIDLTDPKKGLLTISFPATEMDQVATPEIAVSKSQPSNREEGVTLTITQVDGVTYYYTLDGTDPSESSTRIEYKGVATLPAPDNNNQVDMLIKVIGVRDGYINSTIAETTVYYQAVVNVTVTSSIAKETPKEIYVDLSIKDIELNKDNFTVTKNDSEYTDFTVAKQGNGFDYILTMDDAANSTDVFTVTITKLGHIFTGTSVDNYVQPADTEVTVTNSIANETPNNINVKLDKDVTGLVKADFAVTKGGADYTDFTVTETNAQNYILVMSDEAINGDKFTVTITKAGYAFAGTEVTNNVGEGYVINFEQPDNGSLTVKVGDDEKTSGQRILKDETVTITVSPNADKQLLDLKVNGQKTLYNLAEDKVGTEFTFTMPEKNVTMAATVGDPKTIKVGSETPINLVNGKLGESGDLDKLIWSYFANTLTMEDYAGTHIEEGTLKDITIKVVGASNKLEAGKKEALFFDKIKIIGSGKLTLESQYFRAVYVRETAGMIINEATVEINMVGAKDVSSTNKRLFGINGEVTVQGFGKLIINMTPDETADKHTISAATNIILEGDQAEAHIDLAGETGKFYTTYIYDNIPRIQGNWKTENPSYYDKAAYKVEASWCGADGTKNNPIKIKYTVDGNVGAIGTDITETADVKFYLWPAILTMYADSEFNNPITEKSLSTGINTVYIKTNDNKYYEITIMKD